MDPRGFLDWHGPMLPEQPDTRRGPRPHAGRAADDRRHRIGIDTGAVKGGALTCAVLEGRTVRFLSA